MAKQKQTLTQKAFADLCGVTRQNINNAIKKGLIITAVRSGTKVVWYDHQVTQAYMEKRQAEAGITAHRQTAPPTAVKPPKSKKGELLSLQERKVHEEIRKITADANLKELQYQEKQGSLIEKDTEGAILFQYLDALNINMLEFPEMVVDILIDRILAGATRGDIVRYLREEIEKPIKATKQQIIERLK